jgi:gamma-glutamyltranspeptidase/glutathione hydrolase
VHVALATSSQLAADAGAEVARQGGNAADAAVAAALVSLVTEPGVVDPGAGAYALVWPPHGPAVSVDAGIEMPGRGLPPDRFGSGLREARLDYAGGVTTLVGPGSIGTPGAIAGLARIAVRWGRLAWRDLVEPARRHARDGFPLSFAALRYMEHAREPIFGWQEESRRALSRAAGSPVGPGDRVLVEGLADSLARLADAGASDLYTGELGRRLADAVLAAGGILTREDLAAYEVVERVALEVEMDGWRVATNPPPAVGGAVLAAMLLLVGDRPHGRWTPQDVARLARVQEAALRHRHERLDQAEDLPAAVGSLLAEAVPGPLRRFVTSPSTCHTSAVDGDGLAVSVTLSSGYGSGMIPGGTGLWMNNCLGELELNRRGVHGWPPGRRLPSNMAPTVARGPSGERLAVGSPGSDRITTAILQTLLAHLRLGLPLGEAVAHPRLHVALEEAGPRALHEPGLPVAELGMPRTEMPLHAMMFGGVAAARLGPEGRLEAAADPRRAGRTAIVEGG